LLVVNEAAIGHAAEQRNYSPDRWAKVQLMLEHGEIWKMSDGEYRVLTFIDGRTFALPITPTSDGAVFRVRTLFETGLARVNKTRKSGTLVQEANPKYKPGQEKQADGGT
jgi:hypothetical protein